MKPDRWVSALVLLFALDLMACTGSSPAALAQGSQSAESAVPHNSAEPAADERSPAELELLVAADLGPHAAIESVETWFVVGSTASEALHRRGLGTIRRVYRALYLEYLETPPDEAVRVYLFGDAQSYAAYVRETYGQEPSTPFGFYRSDERKMVMNLATGTGTLAHELVHPLVAHDFPEIPSWFNEGFASLFEQSHALPDGRMRGLVNWRLPDLQASLEDGSAPPLADVMAMSTEVFYGPDSGLYYAMARYFCMYLQETDQLKDFYRAYRDGYADDPTGEATLEAVVGAPVDQFEDTWRTWITQLTWSADG